MYCSPDERWATSHVAPLRKALKIVSPNVKNWRIFHFCSPIEEGATHVVAPLRDEIQQEGREKGETLPTTGSVSLNGTTILSFFA